MHKSLRTLLIDIADEFQNDYLTIATFSDHNGLTIEEAKDLIKLAQAVRSHPHPDA